MSEWVEPCSPRLRWAAVAFLAVYLPSYELAYGFVNFLFLCNLTVILCAVGLWSCNRLLLSSQAIAILLIGALWTLDAGGRLLLGRHLVGGTEYMWEARWPLVTRLMSLYHVLLPIVLVLVLRRTGYDPRGYWLQSAIALVGVTVGRLAGSTANINYAFSDPILKRSWGGALVHLAVVAGALVLVVYPLSHLLLSWLCPRRPACSPSPSS